MEVSLELRDVKMQYSHDLEVRKTRKIRQSKQMPPPLRFFVFSDSAIHH